MRPITGLNEASPFAVTVVAEVAMPATITMAVLLSQEYINIAKHLRKGRQAGCNCLCDVRDSSGASLRCIRR